jgi:epoxyqueuosine reductase
LVSVELQADTPFIQDHCGTCNQCQIACPTNALSTPYQLDANRCISYLTIERKSYLTPELKKALNHWILGCDICQEVCPWNRFSQQNEEQDFSSKITEDLYQLQHLIKMSEEDFKKVFAGTPVVRAGHNRFMESLKAVKENIGD